MADLSGPVSSAVKLQTNAAAGAAEPSAEEKELQFGQVWDQAGQTDRSVPNRPGGLERRKSSVQFSTEGAEETIRRHSISTGAQRGSISSQRLPSPPPPPTYHRGVSFDTFDNKDSTVESFTLQYRHTDYQNSTRTRTFLCGTDTKDYSEFAAEWMMDELIDDGDEIICLRVIERESKLAAEPNVERGKYREEAQKLLDGVIKKNTEDKAISIILELAIGRVESVIQRMIQLYEPAALIVGTRGRNLGGMQGLLPGSVSKYCLQHSPVPVIVVRPSSKRNKKKQKRMQVTGRGLYSTMLNQATTTGRLSIYDKSAIESSTAPRVTKQESEAVAQAIGPPKGILRNHVPRPITSVPDNPSETGTGFALPIGYLSTESAPRADLAMKSPIIAALGEWDDSPAGSRPRSPAPKSKANKDEEAVTDSEEDEAGKPTIIDHRRPSTRETTPWLNSILRQPERPQSRGRDRSHSRNRSISRER